MSESFSVGEIALMLPPIECRCERCMACVGEIVTIVEPLQPVWHINGGYAYGIRSLQGVARWTRPEMLQRLPPVQDEILTEETSHV